MGWLIGAVVVLAAGRVEAAGVGDAAAAVPAGTIDAPRAAWDPPPTLDPKPATMTPAITPATTPDTPPAPAGATTAGARVVGDPEASADAEAPMGAPSDPGVSSVPLGPERWTLPPAVIAAVRAARTLSIGARMEAATHAFLGLPYLNDAAGEGTGVDPDPPSRYDAFDCLTFVEETLGLALAGDPLYAPAIRDALRYRGTPSYDHRRHFMEAEWIPDAIANGLVEDITARVGHARTLTKAVSLPMWQHWRHRALLHLADALLPVGEWTLQYLDLAEATLAVPRIPPGALVVTIRCDRPGIPVVVTHISMVVPPPPGSKPGAEPLMRHATRMGLRTVRDDRFGWYTTHLRDYTRWPSLGIVVLLPREQGPRISALTPTVLPPPFPPAEGPLPQFVPQPIPPFPGPARGPDVAQAAP
jgi:hypothetical protein